MNILKERNILLDLEANNRDDVFRYIADICLKDNIVNNKEELIKSFIDREELTSTAFEDGFCIPHARNNFIQNAAVFFVRLKTPIIWDNDKKMVDSLILLVIPESNGDYLDILANIARKLMIKENKKILKTTNNKKEIIDILINQEIKELKIKEKPSNALKIVGISACATGVVHTYMARDAIIKVCEKLNWKCSVETQGQKGQEFKLKPHEIEEADAVILAIDIAVDLDRFAGKKIYKVGTKTLIEDPETQVRYAVSKGKVITKQSAESGVFDIKNSRAWIQHIMSGISFMIPFIVFSGIIFATITGIGKMVYGTWLDYSGSWDGHLNHYIQNVTNNASITLKSGAYWLDANHTMVEIDSPLISTFCSINQFANIGFGVMIPIMGAYIANSIAGRSAIAPAFILTSCGTTPAMWWHWGFFSSNIKSPFDGSATTLDKLFPSNGGGIFAALLFGFVIGYTVKWINTKWRINQFIKPIMPIIIIPVFVSLFYGLITIFILGNMFGLIMGYVNYGLQKLEQQQIGMAFLGLVLGLLAGVDMGGPINKIASFGATALIATDGGKAMGCAAASFAIAPLGAGIASQIFRKKFQNDQGLGINATVLGFMGISEGAIPFAAKYTWAAFIPNIIFSGVAGMLAGLFQVSGWVGAWGGPIIALFGGVTTWSMSYVGILWYFIAIAIAVALHIITFRILVGFKTDEGWKGSIKSLHVEFKNNKYKLFTKKIESLKEELTAIEFKKADEIKNAKLNGLDIENVKHNFNILINNKKSEIKSLKSDYKNIKNNEKNIYKNYLKKENQLLKQNKSSLYDANHSINIKAKEELKKLITGFSKTYANKAEKIKSKKAFNEQKNEIISYKEDKKFKNYADITISEFKKYQSELAKINI